MRVGLAAVLLGCFGGGLASAEPVFDRRQPGSGFRIVEQTGLTRYPLLTQRDGVRMYAVPEHHATSRQWVRAAAGGGASVENLFVQQIGYAGTDCATQPTCNGGPCNVLELTWDAPEDNPLGVDVLVNGQFFGTAAPEVVGVFLGGVPPGPVTLQARERRPEGSPPAEVLEISIVVLDAPPFAEPTSTGCSEEDIAGNGTCTMRLGFENEAPPDVYGVFLNGSFRGITAGANTDVGFLGLTPGQYVVTLQGLVTDENGSYLGCLTEVTCTVFCRRTEACQPPFGLAAVQTAYGNEAGGGSLELAWINGEPAYAAGITLLVNGAAQAALPGTQSSTRVEDLPAGPTTATLQGDCGELGVSSPEETTHELLTETPHPNPIEEGSLSCTWNEAGGGQTELSWVNADPSLLVLVDVEVGGVPVRIGSLTSPASATTITGTVATQPITLRFVAPSDGNLYASEPLRCVPAGEEAGERFVRGICNGLQLDLTAAVFLLTFLFQGGETPPCVEACDADANRAVEVTDAVFLLNFLFQGGVPPVGWPPEGDPSCEEAGPEADCAVSHETCEA